MRTENICTENLMTELDALINVHNEGKNWDRYYIIETTGSLEVYFTLYRYNKIVSQYANPYKYIKNISIDIETSVKKVIKNSTIPILLASSDNNNPLIRNFRNRIKEGIVYIPFGKFAGKTIEQVWDIEKNWVLWFLKNYKVGTYTFNGVTREHKRTDADNILIEQAKILNELFWTELTEKNQNECTSNYIGTIKGRGTFNFTVLNTKNVSSDFGDSIVVNCVDDNGNLGYFYDSKELNLVKDDKIVLIGTPTKHFEKIGKKTTYFNRVNVSKI